MNIISGSALPSIAACSSSKENQPSQILFVVYGIEFQYRVKAFDHKANMLSDYCFTIPCSFPRRMGFAGIGSTLYMIGGRNSIERRKHFNNSPHSLDVYTFNIENISSSLIEGRLLDLNSVQLGPKLNGHKYRPFVFTIKGCIYVLSEYVVLDQFHPNFEVLDPSHGSWCVLPDPPICVNHWKLPSKYHFQIESHAVKDDKYIVISVSKRLGVYVFDITLRTWSFAVRGPLSFYDKSVSLNGFHYAFSKTHYNPDGVLLVFSDIMGSPLGEMKIQPASPNVFWDYLSELVVMGDVVFIARVGFAEREDHDFDGQNHHMTVDRFRVKMKENKELGTFQPSTTKRRSNKIQLEDAARTSILLYCVPLSLA